MDKEEEEEEDLTWDMRRTSRLSETFGNLGLGLVHRVTELYSTTIWA